MKTPAPQPGTLSWKLVKFFVDHVNWCEGRYYGTEDEKPDNPVYNWFYKHWLFPFDQNDCLCCNTVRGVMYGLLAGFCIGVWYAG